jgi:hypothetical protein
MSSSVTGIFLSFVPDSNPEVIPVKRMRQNEGSVKYSPINVPWVLINLVGIFWDSHPFIAECSASILVRHTGATPGHIGVDAGLLGKELPS